MKNWVMDYQIPIITHHFELLIMDLKFNMRTYMENEPDMSSDVVLVALDDASKIASGNEYLWPYDYYAETVKKITDGKPTSFGMDIIFTNTVDATGWSSLIDELSESYLAVNPYMVKIGDKTNPLDVSLHRDIIKELTMEKLPVVGSQDINHEEDIIYKTHPELQEVSSGIGFANIELDPDGVLRRLPIVAELNEMLVPHFFLKLLCEHFGYNIGNIELTNSHKLILNNFPVICGVNIF